MSSLPATILKISATPPRPWPNAPNVHGSCRVTFGPLASDHTISSYTSICRESESPSSASCVCLWTSNGTCGWNEEKGGWLLPDRLRIAESDKLPMPPGNAFDIREPSAPPALAKRPGPAALASPVSHDPPAYRPCYRRWRHALWTAAAIVLSIAARVGLRLPAASKLPG